MIDIRKLREFRQEKGLTLAELGRNTGYFDLGPLELGKRSTLNVTIFQRLCQELALDPFETLELLKLWPVPAKTVIRFRAACKREGTTPLQALLDFMEVYINE
jgi:transcriptional regulator with XRE-family HTH domain